LSPDDVALILHTSGTTSRPKIVPLLQSNVAASAKNIAPRCADADDRCLNVMPLFHIHGLVAAVSVSLSAGGSVWCAPGFDALKFFGWLREASRPGTPPCRPCIRRSCRARAQRRDHRERAPALPALVLGLAAAQVMASWPRPSARRWSKATA
jgi:acyl-CoA synthetase (AMP-forming)/AMP-acid ligase II